MNLRCVMSNDAMSSRSNVAAQVAAQTCGVKVGPVAVLGVAVDRSGETRTACTTNQGPVTLTQNRPRGAALDRCLAGRGLLAVQATSRVRPSAR